MRTRLSQNPTTILSVLGFFGDGSDGALTFDGSSTVLGMAPSSNVYTMTKDIYASSIQINSGVTIKPLGFRIFCTGTLTNQGTIQGDGNPGSGSTGGATISTSGVYQVGAGGGGAGRSTTGAGSAGVGSGGQNITGAGGGAGGSDGGANAGGAGNNSAAPNANAGYWRHLAPWHWGRIPGATSTTLLGMNGTGGGGGGGCNVGTGTATSGGGGSAALFVAIFTRSLNNTGSITANGGNGAAASNITGDGKAGGGGGGGGGVVVYLCPNVIATGTIAANGGTGGNGGGGGNAGNNGGNGIVIVL